MQQLRRGNMPKTPRSDNGTKRKEYKSSMETRGQAEKEVFPVKFFWRKHKMEDIICLSNEELDKIIDQSLDDYKEHNLIKDKGWWYPTLPKSTLNDVRNKKTEIDKGPMNKYN
jgi:hypothetical protein